MRTLCAEVDEYDRQNGDKMLTDEDDTEIVKDIDKTALKGAVDVFHRVFMNDLMAVAKKQLRDKADRASAQNIDF